MSPTTDKLTGDGNPGGGWDEPQLPEGAGTTQPPSQANHPLRPSMSLARRKIELASPNPLSAFTPCLGSPISYN